MSFNARVLKVLIASPGDVSGERVAAQSIIQNWNVTHTDERKTVLLAIMWETHSSPAVGDRAQSIINRQIVKDADLLVAMFWTRIGTPTGAAKSGTVEEIEEHLKAGKPAMLYFSSAPVRPDSLDETQYAEVKAFKASMKERGLYEEYESLEQFREKFGRHLTLTIQREFPIEGQHTQPPDRGEPQGGADIEFKIRGDDRDLIGEALPQEARALLAEATKDRDGTVLMLHTFGGVSVETNGRQFVELKNPRSEARWRRVVEDLVREAVLQQRDSEGQVFSVTDAGYRIADQLVPSGKS